MPRTARIILPDFAHHVTQRGIRKSDVFFSAGDRSLYLTLLHEQAFVHKIEVLAYCLMSNHVHHILVPKDTKSIALLFRHVHSRYSQIINKRYGWIGHLWQNRFFSCPLEENHLLCAIRYVELNPVRAGVSLKAEDYPWSSAQSHVLNKVNPILTQSSSWLDFKSNITDNWSQWLLEGLTEEEISKLRTQTNRGLPCGSKDFSQKVEVITGKSFIKIRGRPRK